MVKKHLIGFQLAAFLVGTAFWAYASDELGSASNQGAETTPAMQSVYQLPSHVVTGQPPVQPIAFSHARHVGKLALDCAVCHVGAGPGASQFAQTVDGKHMTLPDTLVCMNCHIVIATTNPDIQTLADYHASEAKVPWVRVYRVLDGVNWTHKSHLSAGVECQTCHGDVATMEVLAVASSVTAMATCLNCHRSNNASSRCETCHAWPNDESFQRWTN